jgi:hypothetical protein
MADTPVVSGPLPVWYTAACLDKQPDAGHAGGWGSSESALDSLATPPSVEFPAAEE